ncbi:MULTISPECIES: LacI family DNA-binding transcriptional regulator [unclassified Streptomyces]|uniref:LacI family DNA-binding transcriptional regulator n=1 Tax=unclassified Streptomyces TaxID=2593676 RepID=UPI002877875E|nr:LacI family DNA-binding transcriptional regulator [Streptomyces sp. BB1-1-1]WND39109.1 LacI family DNA-binding transcriptional regulator [Streptomyces sp. BB1-1-1]
MNRQAPTLEDVAREAGVSRATVSRVVNGVRNVDPSIQDLVRSAIERTGYTPNRAARALVTRRTGAVALIVSGAGDAFAGRVFADPFFGRVVNGVVGYLRARMTQPVLLFAESAAARTQVVDYLRQGSADGALVVSVQPDDPLPDMLLTARVPTVLFARPTRETPVSCVDLDHRAGGRLAGEHLLGRGCRRIAVIGAPTDLRAGRERLAGFRDALARAGHDSPPVAEGVFTLDSGAVAMAALLRDHPAVDGVFAANDLMAQGACQVVRELGRRIPEDVAVVGFDDSSIAVTCRPPLTTVRQPVEEMAAAMARMLDEQVQGTRTEPRTLVFEPELVVRESA